MFKLKHAFMKFSEDSKQDSMQMVNKMERKKQLFTIAQMLLGTNKI